MERVSILMDMVKEEYEVHEQYKSALARYQDELEAWRSNIDEGQARIYHYCPVRPSKPSVEKLKRLLLVLRQETIALEKRL